MYTDVELILIKWVERWVLVTQFLLLWIAVALSGILYCLWEKIS